MKRIAIAAAALALLALVGYVSASQLVRRMDQQTSLVLKASDTPSEIGPLLGSLKSSTGDIVFLREVRIAPGPAPGLFFAIDRKGSKLVVLSSAPAVNSCSNGFCNLTGAITPFPSLPAMQREWKLKKAPAAELRSQVAYLRADRMWPAGHAHRAVRSR